MFEKSIRANAVLNIVYTMSNMLFPIITFPYVSRILHVEMIGNVSFYQNLSNYTIMLASLGISTYGIRAVARVRDDRNKLTKVVQELLIMNIVATIVAVAALIVSSFLVRRIRTDITLLLINLCLIVSAPFSINWLFSGLEQYEYITKRALTIKLISLVLIFLFVKEQEDYVIYALIIALSSISTSVVNSVYANKFISYKPTKCDFYYHFRPMLVLFASILAINIYTHLDTVMLGIVCDDKQVGLYTVSIYVKTALLTLVNAISAVILPRISFYHKKHNMDGISVILTRSLNTVLLIAIPVSIFFIFEAEECVLLMAGSEYNGAIPCMRIIMPILIISGLSNVTGNQVLIPTEKEHLFLAAVVSGAVIDIILNVLLMPRYGCVGAAFATLFAETVQMTIQLICVGGLIIRIIRISSLYKALISVIGASAIWFLLYKTVDTTVILHFAICFTAYFASYILFLLLQREDEIVSFCQWIRASSKRFS